MVLAGTHYGLMLFLSITLSWCLFSRDYCVEQAWAGPGQAGQASRPIKIQYFSRDYQITKTVHVHQQEAIIIKLQQ